MGAMSAELLAAIFEHGSAVDVSGSFAVLAAVAYLADEDGLAQVSAAQIAQSARTSVGSTRRALTALCIVGDLSIVDRASGRRPPTYAVARAHSAPYGPLATQVARASSAVNGVDRAGCVPNERAQASRVRPRSLPSTEEPLTTGQETHVDELPLVDHDLVDQALDVWCESTGRRRASVKRTPKRVRIIAAAIKTHGFTDVTDALRGHQFDPWEDRPQHTEIELLLRDAAHIEKFRDLERNGRPAAVPRMSRNMRNLHTEAQPQHDERRGNGHARPDDLLVVEARSTARSDARMA